MKILSPAEMRDLDQAAIEELGIPDAVLMENAASAVLNVLLKEIDPFLQKQGGVVICGTGNNGGDGLALARKIHSLNLPLSVLIFGSLERFSTVSEQNLKILKNLPLPLLVNPDMDQAEKLIGQAGYLIDALFGTGLNRPVEGISRNIIRFINKSGKPVLSVDIPSGVQGGNGEISGEAVTAKACITFGNPKWGNVLYPGFARQGKLYCSHISFPPEYYNCKTYTKEINLPPPLPERDPEGYKHSFGKILLIGGGSNYFGAPALAANAIFRSGAGFVTAAIPDYMAVPFSSLCTEAVLEPLESTGAGSIHPSNLQKILELAKSHDAVILGPGITRNPQTRELIKELIPRIPAPLLIDADALSVLAEDPALASKRREATILTPHKGEQRALLAKLSDNSTIENSYNAITVYKGPHSRICFHGGEEYINMTGNSGMGTAGSGDVLTGIIMGLIKQLGTGNAVRTGVLLHGLAGDLAAEELGAESLVASDLIRFLPDAIKFYRKNHEQLTESCYNTIQTIP